jgi:peptide-methionine (S)-S-oxide reductase
MPKFPSSGFAMLFAGAVLSAASLPNPAVDAPKSEKKTDVAVVAGGCFWGIEAVFDSLKGVTDAVSGYAGGSKSTAHYEIVSTGTTGHAESVQITYDPSQISYGQLLKIFFTVHDPTEVNRQGPDDGSQYRSEIFYTNEEQKKVAEAYIQQLNASKVFHKPIATKVEPLKEFYRAEDYHQDYAVKNPNQAYIVYNDLPKVAHVRQEFPTMVKGAK